MLLGFERGLVYFGSEIMFYISNIVKLNEFKELLGKHWRKKSESEIQEKNPIAQVMRK